MLFDHKILYRLMFLLTFVRGKTIVYFHVYISGWVVSIVFSIFFAKFYTKNSTRYIDVLVSNWKIVFYLYIPIITKIRRGSYIIVIVLFFHTKKHWYKELMSWRSIMLLRISLPISDELLSL